MFFPIRDLFMLPSTSTLLDRSIKRTCVDHSKLELYLRRLLKEALRQQIQAMLDMGDLAMSRLTKCLLYVSKNERDEHGVLLCTGSWSNSCQSFSSYKPKEPLFSYLGADRKDLGAGNVGP